MTKETHHMTVYESPGYGPAVPVIRLQGRWLEELGYNIGKKYTVTAKGRRLTIPLEDPAPSSATQAK